MSQAQFAAAVRAAGASLGEPNGANKRLVQKWESGEHAACRPNYARALEALTGASIRDLGLADARDRWAAASADELRHRLARLDTVPLNDAALRWSFALERPRRVSTYEIDALQQLSKRLFWLEAITPARTLLPMVQRQLSDTAVALAAARSPQARRALTLAGGHTAVAAGRLALDCADTQGAQRYLDVAMATARAVDDELLTACVLTDAAALEAENGNQHYAWQLAQSAPPHAEEDTRAHAWVAVNAARAAARCGERASALDLLNLVAELGRVIQSTPPRPETPPWARLINPGILAAVAAEAYTALGDDQTALKHAQHAVLVLGAATKWRAVALAEAALAAARVGNTASVGRWAAEARVLADRLTCAAARRKLSTLDSWFAQPENAGLAEQLGVRRRANGGARPEAVSVSSPKGHEGDVR